MISQIKTSLWYAKHGLWRPPWWGWSPFQSRGFAQCVEEIRTASPGPPPRRSVDKLRLYWGQGENAAGTDLMMTALRHATRRGDALVECGSGLSTLLFGIYGDAWGRPTFALEQYAPWGVEIRGYLAEHGIKGAVILDAPLRSYGDYEWYELPNELPQRIGTVFCDGPPATGEGQGQARYGAVPALLGRLADDALVLLDDANRPGERSVLERWGREFGATSSCPSTERPYAEVSLSR